MKQPNKCKAKNLCNAVRVWLLILLMMLVPISSYAFSPVQITISVSQYFLDSNGSSFPSTLSGEYQLTRDRERNPMPAGSIDGQYTFSLTGDQQLELGPIEFPGPGIYSYKLERVLSPSFMFMPSSRTYYITVYIKNDSSHMVVINNADGSKAPQIQWLYTYRTSTSSVDKPNKGNPVTDSPVSPDPTEADTSPDTPQTEPSLPEETDSSSKINQLPKTGVDSHIVLWSWLFVLFTLSTILLLIKLSRIND